MKVLVKFAVKRWSLYAALLLGLMSFAAIAAQPDGALSYRPRFVGLEKTGLERRAREISILFGQEKTPPASRAALDRRIREDERSLQRLLRAEGYYAATIEPGIGQGDGGRLDITLAIAPGPRFSFAPMVVEPAGDISAEAVAALDVLRQPYADRPARSDDILAAEALISGRLRQLGYPFARIIDRKVVVDHASQKVTVRWQLDPGSQLFYGELSFDGLQSVKPAYLERLLRWRQGGVYDQREVEQSRADLALAGLFSSVRIEAQPPAPGDNRAPMLIQVEEAPHRTVTLGADFSSTEGPGISAGWTHRNLFGEGEILDLLATASLIEQGISAKLTKPAFRRRDQKLLSGAEIKREDNDAFTSHGVNASVGLERQLSPKWIATLGTTAEYVDITDSFGSRVFYLAALPASLRFDGSDDLFDPQSGGRLALNLSPEASFNNGIASFLSNEISGSYYQAVAQDRLVLAARARLGAIIGAQLANIPANRRFFAGGGGSIRGYGYQNVGPLDANGDPIGGRSLVEFGFETRARLSEHIGIAPFIEGGNVYSDATPSFKGLRWGAGLGLRYHTAFAPIRFDIGIPLNRRQGEDRFQVYVGIGQAF